MKKIKNYINWDFLVFSVVISAIKITFGDYAFGKSDLTAHLIPIFRHINSEFLVNDFFTNYSVEFGPTYYFSIFISKLASLFELNYIFFGGVYIVYLITSLTTLVFAKNVIKSSKLGCYLSCLVVMTIDPFNLGGGGWLVGAHFKPATFVRLFMFPSLLFSFKNAYLSFLFLCLGSLIHPTISLETSIYVFLILFIRRIYKSKESFKLSLSYIIKNYLDIILSLLFFCLFILVYWLIPYSSSIQSSSSNFLEPFLFRTFNDVMPSFFNYKGYLYCFIFFLFFFVSLNWYQKNIINYEIILISKVLIFLTFFLCFLGYVFVEIFPTRITASAMLFRMLYIPKWFGILFICSSFALSIKYGNNNHPIIHIWKKLISYASFKSLRFIRNDLLIGFSIIYFLLPAILPHADHPGLALVFSASLLLWFIYFKKDYIRLLIPLFSSFILIFDVFNSILPLPNKIKKFYPKTEISYDVFDNGAEGVVDFVKKNIKEDAIFVVPPNFGSFRFAAKRSIIVDRKCVLFNDVGLQMWWERINDCYGDLPKNMSPDVKNMGMYTNYESISKKRIQSLKRKYNASHAILYSNNNIDEKVLYSDNNYKLIEIK